MTPLSSLIICALANDKEEQTHQYTGVFRVETHRYTGVFAPNGEKK